MYCSPPSTHLNPLPSFGSISVECVDFLFPNQSKKSGSVMSLRSTQSWLITTLQSMIASESREVYWVKVGIKIRYGKAWAKPDVHAGNYTNVLFIACMLFIWI